MPQNLQTLPFKRERVNFFGGGLSEEEIEFDKLTMEGRMKINSITY
jgi:hypothetical protein